MEALARQTASFRAKAVELRAKAEAYMIPELRTGILEIADSWEQLERRIEADGAAQPKRDPGHEYRSGPEPCCGEPRKDTA